LLAPVWTILILGWITGNEHARIGGSGSSLFRPDPNLWLILCGFSLLVASIYVVNQIVDIESDRINHKLFILPNKIISVHTAWILAGICAGSGFLIGFFYDYVMASLFIISLFLGVLYNLPPFQLKNHAWGGVIMNTLGHGMLTFLVGWYCSKIGTKVDLPIFYKGLISSISPALANGAVFLATTIPDSEGDRLTKKQTFCVKYGEKSTAICAALFCLGAVIFSFKMEYHFWVMAIPSSVSFIFFLAFAFSPNRDLAFKTFKWPVFLLSISVALFVPEYGILILLTFFGSREYYKRRFGIEYPTFKAK
jgi:4-hydroxybenzoate polyprenyltransferase